MTLVRESNSRCLRPWQLLIQVSLKVTKYVCLVALNVNFRGRIAVERRKKR